MLHSNSNSHSSYKIKSLNKFHPSLLSIYPSGASTAALPLTERRSLEIGLLILNKNLQNNEPNSNRQSLFRNNSMICPLPLSRFLFTFPLKRVLQAVSSTLPPCLSVSSSISHLQKKRLLWEHASKTIINSTELRQCLLPPYDGDISSTFFICIICFQSQAVVTPPAPHSFRRPKIAPELRQPPSLPRIRNCHRLLRML